MGLFERKVAIIIFQKAVCRKNFCFAAIDPHAFVLLHIGQNITKPSPLHFFLEQFIKLSY